MAKKSNKNLFIVFGIVLAIFVVYSLLDSNDFEGTFRSKIIEVDTARVDEILITLRNNSGTTKLVKENGEWLVLIDGNNKVKVKNTKIDEILRITSAVTADIIVSRDPGKWSEYYVDSSGIRVEMFADGDKRADFIIGKFMVKQQKTIFTYVRLFENDDVYRVEGVLTVPFDRQPDDFRNNTLVADNVQHWISITYEDGGNGDYTLRQTEGGWTLDGNPANTENVTSYLTALSNLNHALFADGYDGNLLDNPQYTLTITRQIKEPIVIKAAQEDSLFIIHSSENPTEFFADRDSTLFNTLFTGKKHFMP